MNNIQHSLRGHWAKPVFICILFIVTRGSAEAFSVNPMVAELDPNLPYSQQVFVLANSSLDEKAIEVVVGKPMIDENGKETLELGNGEGEFLIVPQQLALPPNARRSVKVLYVGDAREEEDTYRVIFRELPVQLPSAAGDLSEGESSFNMRVLMEYQTRVWLTPRGLEEDLRVTGFNIVEIAALKSREGETGPGSGDALKKTPMLHFTVANLGRRHGYLRHPILVLTSEDGASFRLSGKDVDRIAGQVVLKKSEKHFMIPWRDDFPAFSQIDEVRLTTGRR